MNSTGIRTACNFSFWPASHYTTCISEHHHTALIVSLSVWIQNYKASQMCRLKYQANWFTFAFNWFSSSFPRPRMLMVITDSYPVYLNVCCVFCSGKLSHQTQASLLFETNTKHPILQQKRTAHDIASHEEKNHWLKIVLRTYAQYFHTIKLLLSN